MTVRCVQCGQENNPQYRFCGMCGAPLGAPPVAVTNEVGRERVRIPVTGPSFLGLGDEGSRDLDYLLEDEPAKGRGRLYFALLLLLVSAGLLAWHWQRDGFPWTNYFQKQAVGKAAVSTPPAPAADSAAAAAPIVPVEPTANPAPPETPTVAGESPTPAVEPSPGASASAAALKPGDQPAPGSSQNNEGSEPGEAAAKTPAAVSSPATEAAVAEPSPKETQPSTMAPAPKAAVTKPSPTIPAPTFEDKLVADGERYLYGRGVPEDCARAQRNLQIAARQSNPKAQTLLGAMYMTGHCVGRDLPTSYRWFANALHADPGNSRVQQAMEVLWKQMTPEERQLAIRNR